MNARLSDQRGFSLAEMMVSLTVMLIIIVAIFSIIVAEQSTHLTEGRKLDMNQGGRVVEQMLTEGFRSAASVLSLANTPVLLGSPALSFNGIYPLNNANFPDGVILASGDPLALTRLTSAFAPLGQLVDVQTALRPDGSGLLAWQAGDYGMVMRSGATAGYYVFRVVSATANQLNVRSEPAYYSGLLNIPADLSLYFPGYNDQCDERFGAGNINSYPVDSPVVRLDYFSIFLTRASSDGININKTLTLTTDCEGEADIFTNPKANAAMPILPNIEDIQIDYVTKVTPPAVLPDIWAGVAPAAGGNGYPDPCGGLGTNCPGFYNQFFTKNIASARIYVLLRTEEEKNKHLGSGIVYKKPPMGDVGGSTLPVGRYHYTYMQFQVFIRNYSL